MSNNDIQQECTSQGSPNWIWPTTLTFCTSAILVAAFRWFLVDMLTVFLEPLLETALWIAIVWLLVICSVRSVIHRKEHPIAEYKSLGLTAVTFLTLMFFPFNALTLKANFFMYRSHREQLAPCLLAKTCGTITQSGSRGDFVALPQGAGFLSSGGEVTIDHRDGKSFILFLTFRGILDRFSGYVYSPSDEMPAKDQFLGDGAEIEKVAPHWYWYAS